LIRLGSTSFLHHNFVPLSGLIRVATVNENVVGLEIPKQVGDSCPKSTARHCFMRALDEMPYEEIAAALDITLSAARVKVHRARAKLMEARNPIHENLNVSEERR
jgi:Sigma-70, region 4